MTHSAVAAVEPLADLVLEAGNVVNIPASLASLRVGMNYRLLLAGNGMDLSVNAFAFRNGASVAREDDFVFYGNPDAANDALKLYPDLIHVARTGYDEAIDVDFGKLPEDVDRIVFTTSIDDPNALPKYHAGNVAYIEICLEGEVGVVTVTNDDYPGNASGETAFVLGELLKVDGAWKFFFKNELVAGGLAGLCAIYGIKVG